MNKTDLLLQMMEQPQHYTEEEWQEILADEECREALHADVEDPECHLRYPCRSGSH